MWFPDGAQKDFLANDLLCVHVYTVSKFYTRTALSLNKKTHFNITGFGLIPNFKYFELKYIKAAQHKIMEA